MIAFNNGVANIIQTPGIAADTLANRPAATVVAIGTIYITSDTNNIYRSDGENWQLIGSGGGGLNPQTGYIPYNAGTTFKDSYLFNDAANNELYCVAGDTKGFKLYLLDNEFAFGWNDATDNNNIFFSDVISCIIGDPYGNLNHTKLIVNDTNKYIRTYRNTEIAGIDFNYNTNNFNYGTEANFLQIDNGNSLLQTYCNGEKFGYKNTTRVLNLGDYNSVNNSTTININDNSRNISLLANSGITIGVNNTTGVVVGATSLTFNGANLVATGVHTATANHLKVTVNGANYVIQLLTP